MAAPSQVIFGFHLEFARRRGESQTRKDHPVDGLGRAMANAYPAGSSVRPAQFAHSTLQVFFRGAMCPRGQYRLEWLVSAEGHYLKVE